MKVLPLSCTQVPRWQSSCELPPNPGFESNTCGEQVMYKWQVKTDTSMVQGIYWLMFYWIHGIYKSSDKETFISCYSEVTDEILTYQGRSPGSVPVSSASDAPWVKVNSTAHHCRIPGCALDWGASGVLYGWYRSAAEATILLTIAVSGSQFRGKCLWEEVVGKWLVMDDTSTGQDSHRRFPLEYEMHVTQKK